MRARQQRPGQDRPDDKRSIRIVAFRGKWHAVWHDAEGTRHRVSLGVPAEAAQLGDAKRAAADLQRQLNQPLGDTVADIWAAYMTDHGDHTRNPERLRYAWQALQPHFGHLRPDQVDRQACRDYHQARGRAPGTVIKELNCLRAALHWHDKNSPAVIWTPPAPQPKDLHLTKAQFRKLLQAARPVFHLTVFLELAIATAARKEALLSLTWSQVDLERRRINLGLVDGGKSRAVVPINDRLLAALQTAQAVARTAWVVEYADRRVGSIRSALATAAEKADLPRVTPHVLRHSAAVWMAEAGVSMPEIAQYLGHADDRITQRVYARFSPDYQRKAADALEV